MNRKAREYMMTVMSEMFIHDGPGKHRRATGSELRAYAARYASSYPVGKGWRRARKAISSIGHES